MRNQKEYYGDFVDLLDRHVISVKQQFVESMDMIHRILTRDSYVENIIMYSKFSVYYANLLEEKAICEMLCRLSAPASRKSWSTEKRE